MNALAEEGLRLETELYHAIEREDFVFHYQPQLDLESGRICAVEALLRWNHPDTGMLSPAAFLDWIEETGAIVNVGRRRRDGMPPASAMACIWMLSRKGWKLRCSSNVCASLAASGCRAISSAVPADQIADLLGRDWRDAFGHNKPWPDFLLAV